MNLVPAPLGRRLGAYLLDGLVIWGVSLLLGTVMGVATVGPNVYAVPLGWYVMSGIVAFFYMSVKGTALGSVGHRRMGLQLIDERTGGVLGRGRSVGRWLLLGLIPLAPLSPLFDAGSNRGWHDRIVGAMVIDGRASSGVVPATATSLRGRRFATLAVDGGILVALVGALGVAAVRVGYGDDTLGVAVCAGLIAVSLGVPLAFAMLAGRGGTPGMRAAKVAMARADGGTPTRAQAFGGVYLSLSFLMMLGVALAAIALVQAGGSAFSSVLGIVGGVGAWLSAFYVIADVLTLCASARGRTMTDVILRQAAHHSDAVRAAAEAAAAEKAATLDALRPAPVAPITAVSAAGTEPVAQQAEPATYFSDDAPPPPVHTSGFAVEPTFVSGGSGQGGVISAVPGFSSVPAATAVSAPPATPTSAPSPWSNPAVTAAAPAVAVGEDVDATRAAPPRRRATAGALMLRWDDGTQVGIDGPVRMGRNPDAEDGARAVRIFDTTRSLSKSHLLVTPGDGTVLVTDLHSTNGTDVTRSGRVEALVPGRAVALGPGDRIAVGDRTCMVEEAS